jgi:hypothetical protein
MMMVVAVVVVVVVVVCGVIILSWWPRVFRLLASFCLSVYKSLREALRPSLGIGIYYFMYFYANE